MCLQCSSKFTLLPHLDLIVGGHIQTGPTFTEVFKSNQHVPLSLVYWKSFSPEK